MILPILTIPDPFLKTKSAPVKNITPEVEQLISDMLERCVTARIVSA